MLKFMSIVLIGLLTLPNAFAERTSKEEAQSRKHILHVYLNANNKGQALIYEKDGVIQFGTKVSGAGIPGKKTPRGYYLVHNMIRDASSARFNNSPMPCSFFFNGGGLYAVHGTTHVDHLGGPASNGCVRVDPPVICSIFDAIVQAGERDQVAVIVEESPNGLY